MTKFYIKGREAILRVRTDQNGVVSFEYVIVAACVVGAVVLAFGTGAGGAIATALGCLITSIVTQSYRRYRLTKWGHWEFSIPRFSFEAAMVYISILQVPLLLHAAITDVAIRTISNRVTWQLRSSGSSVYQPIFCNSPSRSASL